MVYTLETKSLHLKRLYGQNSGAVDFLPMSLWVLYGY